MARSLQDYSLTCPGLSERSLGLVFYSKSNDNYGMTLTDTQTYLSTARSNAVEFLREIGFLRPSVMQVAAICHRPGPNGIEVLLITSLGTKQWIIPKGWPKKGQSSGDTALDEAYEEAGVRGTVSDQPIGQYRYRKATKDGLQLDCFASVYEVAVSDMEKTFPEAGRRQYEWHTPEIAAERVSNPELSRLLLSFSPSLAA